MNRLENAECDVLVVGSGASGLAAAVTAAHYGLQVVVAEKLSVLGGTTARTAGSMWIPCNHLAAARGIEDNPDKVRTYLRATCGARFDAVRANAFIDAAPRALKFLLTHSLLRVFCPKIGSDYHLELPGSVPVGRSLYTEPFDGRLLKDYFPKLAQPPQVHTFMGIAPQLGIDVIHFLNANRSAASAWYVVRKCFRQVYDRVVYRRGTRLTNGAALAARLLKSALDSGVTVKTSSPVTGLLREGERVVGAFIDTGAGLRLIRVRRGVVLASGGFSRDEPLRKMYFPARMASHMEWSASAAGTTGSGMNLALAVGAAVDNKMAEPAAWSPMSMVPAEDGNPVSLPLFGGRAFPGIIAVTREGKRFVNEASPYHDFSIALMAATRHEPEPVAFLICDSVALRKYGLGYVRPFPIPWGRHLRSGYLSRANTVDELAAVFGIDAQTLASTVATVNRDASSAKDSEFGKGTTEYDLRMGDPQHRPNPCLGPLDRPPFYAIKVNVGDIGTYVGVSTDSLARVLTKSGSVVPGLYAVGNDMSSLFAGSDPAGGVML